MRKSSNLRQSIANAEFNGPSNENSPTTASLKTRRVSFANKKHIKEFCDSTEQGTLWVNTYEESESSQLRNSHDSNTDEHTLCANQEAESSHQRSDKSLQMRRNVGDYDLAQRDSQKRSVVESAFFIDAEVRRVESTARKYGENAPHSNRSFERFAEAERSLANSENTTNFDDSAMDIIPDEMNETTLVSSTLQPATGDGSLLIATGAPNISPKKITIFHDRSMDFTQVVPNVPSFEKHQNIIYEKQNIEKTTVFHDKEMDFTEVVPNVPSFEKHRNVIYEKQNIEKTTLFLDKEMDFTEVVHNLPSFEKQRNIIYEKENIEKTTVFHDKEMDFTEVVHNVPSFEKQRNIIYEKQHIEKTTVFDDKQVNFTAVKEKDGTEKTTIFHNESVDFTEVVPNVPSFEKQQNTIYDRAGTEKTTIFHNESVDFTEVVPNVPSFGKQQNTIYDRAGTEKTTIFHNESVDFTEVVPNIPSFGKQQNTIYDRAGTEKTTIFHNESVDFTEVVPNVPSFEKQQNTIYDRAGTEKTTIFHNESVDFTEVVPNVPSFEKQQNTIYDRAGTEKTTIFHNESVDFTEVVHNVPSVEKHENIARLNTSQKMPELARKVGHFTNIDESRTFIQEMKENIRNIVDLADSGPNLGFDKFDSSMEMTKPQGNLLRGRESGNGSCSRDAVSRKRSFEYSETTANPSLAVSRSKENFITESPTEVNGKHENASKATERSPKTTVFSDDSMELTVAVQFPLQVITKDQEISGIDRTGKMKNNGIFRFSGLVDSEEKENKVHNNLMEIPRAVPRSLQLRAAFLDKENCPLDKENCAPTITETRGQENRIKKPRIRSVSVLEFGGPVDHEKNRAGLSELRAKHCSNDLTDVSGIVPFGREPTKKTWNEGCSKTREKSLGTMFRTEEMEFTEAVPTSFRKSHFNVERTGGEETAEERVQSHEDCSIDGRTWPSEIDTKKNSLSGDIFELNTEKSSAGMEKLLPNASETNVESSILESRDMDLSEIENLSKIDHTVSDESFEILQLLRSRSIVDPRIERAGFPEENIEEPRDESVRDTEFAASQKYHNGGTDLGELDGEVHTDDSNLRDISGVSPFSLKNENGNCVEQESCISTGNSCEKRDNSLLPAAELSDESCSGIGRLDEDVESPSQDGTFNGSIPIDNDADHSDRNLMAKTIDRTRSRSQLIVQDIDGSYLLLDQSVSDESLANEVSNHEPSCSESMMEDNREEIIIEKEPVESGAFSILKETLETLSKRSETIWSIKRMDEKVVAFNFLSKSIVLVVRLQGMSDPEVTRTIRCIDFMSQLIEEKGDPGLQLTHGLVMKKLDAAFLSECFKTHERIVELLEYVSREVRIGMDFLCSLNNLRLHNVMEFKGNRITFLARTRDIMAGIIVNVTVEMKPFEEINCTDVTVVSLLGSEKIKKSKIQHLVTNIRRDQGFLQIYMNDVKDYLDLAAETSACTATV